MFENPQRTCLIQQKEGAPVAADLARLDARSDRWTRRRHLAAARPLLRPRHSRECIVALPAARSALFHPRGTELGAQMDGRHIPHTMAAWPEALPLVALVDAPPRSSTAVPRFAGSMECFGSCSARALSFLIFCM